MFTLRLACAVFIPWFSIPASASSCYWSDLEPIVRTDDVSALERAASACPMMISTVNASRETLLFPAVKHGALRSARWLLDRGVAADTASSDGCTALCGVATKDAAMLLLGRGARIHFADRFGFSPFHHMMPTKNWELLDFMRARGARVERINLEWTGARLHWDIMAYLAAHIDASEVRGHGGFFRYLSFYDKTVQWIAKTLVAKGADLNLAKPNAMGGFSSSLDAYVEHYVVDEYQYRKNGLSAIRFLLEHGADPHGSMQTGIPLLFYALQWKSSDVKTAMEILHLFLRHGFNRDLRDSSGRTLLAYMASHVIRKDDELPYFRVAVAELLALGFDPNVRSADGKTPLHWAIRSFNQPAGQALAAVADLGLRDREGRTPEEFVREQLRTFGGSPREKAVLTAILNGILIRTPRGSGFSSSIRAPSPMRH